MERRSPEEIEADLRVIEERGRGTIFGDKTVQRLVLRKYDSNQDNTRGCTPKYTLATNYVGIGKSFSYSEIEAAQELAQDIRNIPDRRILLVCHPDNVGETLWYTAVSMVEHHNNFMDIVDPITDDNPFKERPGRATISTSHLLERTFKHRTISSAPTSSS